MIKADNIKTFRSQLGIKQVDLAKFLGISSSLLNMIESGQRSVSPEVEQRMAWSELLVAGAAKAFEKIEDQHTRSNKHSIRFAKEALRTKGRELEETEWLHTLLLRENVAFSRKVYLLKQLRPTPGLKTKELNIFEAWQNYLVRLAEVKLEKAGPQAILRIETKIAALQAEIRCLEKHIGN